MNLRRPNMDLQALLAQANDSITVKPMMNLSLSFDHRLIDGHVGAAFTYAVIRLLQSPDRLLMEAPPFSGFANPLISAGNVAVVVYRGMVPVGAYYEKGTGWLQSSIVELDGLGPFQWGTGEIAVELALDRRGNILAVGPTGYQRYLPGDGWQRSADHGLTLGKQRLLRPDGAWRVGGAHPAGTRHVREHAVDRHIDSRNRDAVVGPDYAVAGVDQLGLDGLLAGEQLDDGSGTRLGLGIGREG